MENFDADLLEYLKSFLTERRRKLFDEVLAERTRHFTVVTEDVYQVHNTSAVIRSCDVFGIQDLHVVEERLGKKMDREIAMGAQKWVRVHRHRDSVSCIEKLRSQGYQIVATTPHGEAQELKDFDFRPKSAFFFGTESDGISEEVIQGADTFLTIPMYGFTESLNISVSAAIILQHMVSQLKKSDIEWHLSEKERKLLEMDWTQKTIKSAPEIIERYYASKNA